MQIDFEKAIAFKFESLPMFWKISLSLQMKEKLQIERKKLAT